MTALAKTQNFLMSVLNVIIEARTRQAEFEVAQHLQKEYPKESISYIMEKIREGKVEDLRK